MILRGVIEKVVIHPETDTPGIDLHGELAAILALCKHQTARHADARRGGGRSGQLSLVAGIGFEPMTFRL